VTILNVFSRSLDAPLSDADTVHENDRLTYVSALRRKEDEAFTRQIPGLAMVDLNLKDAPIRLRCDRAAVYEMEMDANDAAIPKIRKAVGAMVEGGGAFGALVVPLGLGGHVDHRVVRYAMLAMGTTMPCGFYEDLPDALREGVSVTESLTPVLLAGTKPDAVEFKRRMAVLYGSQVDGDEARAIAGFSQQYGGAERVWVNGAWVEAGL